MREAAVRTRLGRRATVAMALGALLVLVALCAPLIAPYEPNVLLETDLLKGQAPSLAHPFGTDFSSRDVLSRVIHGARVSLFVATMAVLVTLVVGTSYGTLAALAGGAIDSAMMRVLDVCMSIPRILVLIAVAGIAPRDALWMVVLIIGLTGWFDVARLVRAETGLLLQRDFVLAARAMGTRNRRLLGVHVMPHLIPLLTVSATMGVAYTIGLEAGLSYLGLGVQPPQASWGSIMRDGQGYVDTKWWLTIFPGLATILAVLTCNALGDALRDRFASEQVPA